MSTVYIFPTPTTGQLSFSEAGLGLGEAATDAAPYLPGAEAARLCVRESLKDAKHGKSDAAFLSAAKAIEDYLPYLFTFAQLYYQGINGTPNGSDKPIDLYTIAKDISFQSLWSMPFSGSAFSLLKDSKNSVKNKTRLTTLQEEIHMCILSLGLCYHMLAEIALEKQYSGKSGTSGTDGSGIDRWKAVSGNLARAKLLWDFLAARPSASSVPDLRPAVVSGLQTMLAGSINMAYLHKQMAQSATVAEDSAGSSTSLVFRARVAVYGARSFQTCQTAFPAQFLSRKLRRWLQDAAAYCTAHADRFFAFSCKQPAVNELGKAIALIQAGIEDIEPIFNVSDNPSKLGKLKVGRNGNGSAASAAKTRKTVVKIKDKYSRYISSVSNNEYLFGVSDSALPSAARMAGADDGKSLVEYRLVFFALKLLLSLEDVFEYYSAENDRLVFAPVPQPQEAKSDWPEGAELPLTAPPWSPTTLLGPAAGLNTSDVYRRPSAYY